MASFVALAKAEARIADLERQLARAMECFWMPYDEWHRWRDAVLASRERLAESEAAQAELRGVLEGLADKCDAVADATLGVFVLHQVYGGKYDGPTYEQELKDARAALEKERLTT